MGGSGLAFPQTLARAAAGMQGVETIIPGHDMPGGSRLWTWNQFKEYTEFVQDVVTAAQVGWQAAPTRLRRRERRL